MDGNPGDLLLTSRTDLERLCDLAGRMGLVQLPAIPCRGRWSARTGSHRTYLGALADAADRAESAPADLFHGRRRSRLRPP